MLQIKPVAGEVVALVLCHQGKSIENVSYKFERLNTYVADINVLDLLDGTQEYSLKKKVPYIVIGTPGRIITMPKGKDLFNLKNVRHLILHQCVEILEKHAIGNFQDDEAELTLRGPVHIHKMGDNFDWREKWAILPIRQHGGSHSCWAFGSISTVESLNCIQNGKLIGLSEEHLIDCTVGTKGCKGGAIAASFRHIIEGLDTGKIYPYRGKDGQCDVTDLTCSSVVRHLASKRPLRSFSSFANSRTYMVGKALTRPCLAVRSLCCTLRPPDGRSDTVIPERKRWYSPAELEELNHVVLIVGYGTENGDDYWIVSYKFERLNTWVERAISFVSAGSNSDVLDHIIHKMGDNFDWREVILPIRQQGLSEEHLIDCTVGTRGCKGGAIAASFRHIIECLDTGKIYPCSDKDGQCDVTDLTCSSVVRHLASKRPL
ncbi:hypothetical protein RD792_013089 [Penstemon davidsonii]|uniref:Peptidase C1A papain C-terminal domain-containing protein n=1 Tax=Penstemon davidsonii TaxID=160366 RepID=A0ABR0CT04_9LAMI|nr:hypothetical protein RD792_013089 [Penstemon davidsonii]